MEKETNKDLLRGSDNIITQLIQITKTSDLLKAKPIQDQILKFGRDDVNNEISKSVMKCAVGLGIELSNFESQILIEDLIEVYKWDSIEDIQVCLKNGRQGKYGKTYNKLNMIVFQEWMSQHLEQKAIERESQHNKHKHEWNTKEDYLASVKKGIEDQKEEIKRKKDLEKEIQEDNNEFAKIRAKHQGNSFGTIKPK